MSSVPLKTTNLPTEEIGHTEPHGPVTSTADGTKLVHQNATATSVGAVNGVDDELGVRGAHTPQFRRATVPVDSIIVEETFGRELDDEHVQTLAEIIEHFGNRYPPIVGEDMVLLAGHEQLLAVQRLGHRMVEVIIEMMP
jgi:hypothetical protein